MTDGPITPVMGANKGIGFAIARQLGQAGHMVWLGCRDKKRGDARAPVVLATINAFGPTAGFYACGVLGNLVPHPW